MTVEAQQWLEQFNQTQTHYPHDQCIHHLIELQVERTPDHFAIFFEEQKITYRELNRRANQLAHYLRTLQVGPEVMVGICMKRSPDMVIGLLGILKAGGAYVPLDPAYPQERLAFMVQDSQIPVLITESHLRAKLPEHQAQIIDLNEDWEKIAQYSDANLDSGVTPNNLAYTIYTSGSTGQSKGVQIIHRGVVNFLTSMCHTPGITDQDILLAVTTISFDIAALELYLPLIVGACIFLVSREVSADAIQLIKVINQSDATIMQATPATWRMLLAAGWQGNQQLKILCGGEAMSRDLADQLLKRSAAVWNMYGPTETTIWSMVHHVSPGDASVPIGHPIANTQVYLVDLDEYQKNQQIKQTHVGKPGEVMIGGVGLARGYLNRPQLTQEKFIPNPYSCETDSRLYRTGDLARYLPNGEIEFIGRIDHQVKIRGFRIEIGEIETVLCQHPAIREVVITAHDDKLGNKRLIAYIVPESLQQNSLNILALRHFLQQKLPEYMIPSGFVVLETLPLTPNGKVDRQALPKPDQRLPLLTTAFVAPRTSTEKQLAQIWSQVLEIESIGIHDDFFELGGNSLLSTQLVFQVQKQFQLEFPLICLFQASTIAGMSVAIQNLKLNNHSKKKNFQFPLSTNLIVDLKADLNLDKTILLKKPFTGLQRQPQQIFLTGATGFIGSFVLYEILQKNPKLVYCLVRANSIEAAQQKLQKNFDTYQLPKDKLNTHVVPILGDLTQPLLGLSEFQFQKLATEIDIIYHNGACVNLVLPYPILRAANVLSIQEMLKLATLTKTKPVHFISTLDVFQSPYYTSKKVILEEEDLVHGEALPDGYSQSKWVAEKLMITARSRGIPVCIYRLGTIIGHSQTGAAQTDDLVARLIKGLIQLRYAPELNLQMSLTSVDYVSKAVVHLSQQPTSLSKAFHIVNPHAISFYYLIEQIKEMGYPIEWIDHKKWQEQLLNVTSNQKHPLTPLISLLIERNQGEPSYLETSALVSQAFDCHNTLTGLLGTDIACPDININSRFLQSYISYILR